MLEIDALSKRYNEVVALDAASFVVPPGRIVGFLGPNGAGKTTAMRCIFGLAEPDAGEVRWKGLPVTHETRLRFGYMPEERGLYPKMKVADELAYFGVLSGLPRKKAAAAADHWLTRLGLADRANSRLEELSHGNQQRVQLAAALVHSPQLLVLDEPFAGLDPLGITAMSTLLVDLAEEGVGIVFSSHQLDLVEDVCQDVVIIHKGTVVLSGEVATLRSQTDLIRIEVSVDGVAWSPDLEGMAPATGNARGAGFLVPATIRLDDVLAQAGAEGDVTDFSYGPPHLSDLFRQAVGS